MNCTVTNPKYLAPLEALDWAATLVQSDPHLPDLIINAAWMNPGADEEDLAALRARAKELDEGPDVLANLLDAHDLAPHAEAILADLLFRGR